MYVSFKVSSEGVDGQIYSRAESFLCGLFLDDVRGQRRDLIHEVTIDPEEIPKSARHGKCDVLP